MFAMILRTTWAWTRLQVAAMAMLVFVVPSLMLRPGSGQIEIVSGTVLLDNFASLQLPLTLIAIIGPFVLAALPWSIDAERQHVYALSLPVPWRHYVGMRFAAGALTLLLPAAAVWVSALLLLQRLPPPPELQAYPGALALRFLLATLVAYAATFALQYIAGRRATAVILGMLVGGFVIYVGSMFIGSTVWIETTVRLLTEWPGPLAIFAEPWVLIDV